MKKLLKIAAVLFVLLVAYSMYSNARVLPPLNFNDQEKVKTIAYGVDQATVNKVLDTCHGDPADCMLKLAMMEKEHCEKHGVNYEYTFIEMMADPYTLHQAEKDGVFEMFSPLLILTTKPGGKAVLDDAVKRKLISPVTARVALTWAPRLKADIAAIGHGY
ncbi:hypothetical protein [Edwardsiella tarda]|uniref:hypothetical protein n=1 Tax=Edwardsiella tarda TaxID=636 RepID=UPI00351BFAA6